MITTERVTEITREMVIDMMAYSFVEYMNHESKFKARQFELTLVRNDEVPLCVIGTTRASMVNRAELWVLMFMGCVGNLRPILQARERFHAMFPRTEVLVDPGYPEGLKFAKAFGYTEKYTEQREGRTFVVLGAD